MPSKERDSWPYCPIRASTREDHAEVHRVLDSPNLRAALLVVALVAIGTAIILGTYAGPWVGVLHSIGFMLLTPLLGVRIAGLVLGLGFVIALQFSLASALVIAGYGGSGVVLCAGLLRG